MRYKKLAEFNDEDFRRLTGIKRLTFLKMIEILKRAERDLCINYNLVFFWIIGVF